MVAAVGAAVNLGTQKARHGAVTFLLADRQQGRGGYVAPARGTPLASIAPPEGRGPWSGVAYADGSQRERRGGRASWAVASWRYDRRGCILRSGLLPAGSDASLSELQAVVVAARALPFRGQGLVRTDSMTALVWAQRSWRKSLALLDRQVASGQGPEWALVADLVRVLQGRVGDTVFQWVRGHAGEPGNELVDQEAGRCSATGEPSDRLVWELCPVALAAPAR